MLVDDTVAPGTGDGKRPAHMRSGEAGLTLVEIIVVLAIIALVAALIVPNVIGRPDQARVTTATTDIASISGALKLYRLDNGTYPTTSQGLKALAVRPATPPVPASFPEGGYLSQTPVDPWGNPYAYESNGTTFSLISLGRDGKPGGEGLDADIGGARN
ncbi:MULTISPECIES: type II secretion system major pseudopilin GspG [unclassified Sphingomonas]|jgi:general secretion pathway protein G|uniref:type II secretion system major pseudopilin GspG n=1 Tax=unclassified Sphingomonas TaxID=196159 RepID=UPI000830128C|nr:MULTISPECIES: type II secretion system major pseudopilin GspG [unclassified Sphingomonas]MCH4892095.1 type II secretion system major pseudopilin GspG [Sphingomonas sp. SFZ2018-12]